MDRFKSLSRSADTYPENQEKTRYGKSTLDTLSKGQYIIVNRNFCLIYIFRQRTAERLAGR
jgi:hypothetical protein